MARNFKGSALLDGLGGRLPTDTFAMVDTQERIAARAGCAGGRHPGYSVLARVLITPARSSLAPLCKIFRYHPLRLAAVIRLPLRSRRGLEYGVECGLTIIAKTLLSEAHRSGWLLRQLIRDLDGFAADFIGIDQIIEQAEAKALVAIHQASAQGKLDCTSMAEEGRHYVRPQNAGQSDINFRLTHLSAAMANA